MYQLHSVFVQLLSGTLKLFLYTRMPLPRTHHVHVSNIPLTLPLTQETIKQKKKKKLFYFHDPAPLPTTVPGLAYVTDRIASIAELATFATVVSVALGNE